MNLKIDEGNAYVAVTLSGRLDAITSVEFEKQLLPKAAVPGIKLLIDLQNMDYISSAGLRSLLLLKKAVQKASGRMVLTGLNEMALDVFRVSGFDTLIKVCASNEEGILFLDMQE